MIEELKTETGIWDNDRCAEDLNSIDLLYNIGGNVRDIQKNTIEKKTNVIIITPLNIQIILDNFNDGI
ncbi:MAG: hypothetical protein ACMUIE_08210 [Thermoplasmatota archaeon]